MHIELEKTGRYVYEGGDYPHRYEVNVNSACPSLLVWDSHWDEMGEIIDLTFDPRNSELKGVGHDGIAYSFIKKFRHLIMHY